ncbi:hypothetical protein [Streptomyces sp. NPDC005795]|uniref:hypothetical protein n=1 Tax=Streptomyces sp. NPDC005795 TaxID=3154677 RepID=UPI0033D538C6
MSQQPRRTAWPSTTGEPTAGCAVLPALDSPDLAQLGANDSGCRSQLAVSITEKPAMGCAERQSLLRETLVHMVRRSGHAEVGLV